MTNESQKVNLNDPTIQKVIESLKNGKKLEAMIQYRSTHNVLLSEAMDAVEEIEKALGAGSQ